MCSEERVCNSFAFFSCTINRKKYTKKLKSQWIVDEVTKKSPDESGAYIKINFKIRRSSLWRAKNFLINFFFSLFSPFTFRIYIKNSLKLDVSSWITWRLFLGTSTLAESRRETKILFLCGEYEKINSLKSYMRMKRAEKSLCSQSECVDTGRGFVMWEF